VNNIQIIFCAMLFFLLQLFLVDFLSLKLIRPDFLVIFVLYLSIYKGRIYGILSGFFLGYFSNLFGIGSYFGLEPLSLTIVGYFGGYLKNIYDKVLPYAFHAIWIFIVLFYFFVTSYFRFQNIYITDFSDFFRIWLLTFLYTMLFILSFQFIYPLKEASRAEIS
tara:strand:- start:19 stop:510 length:492 start_codon:yes stop_codon:yes gene_type:complete